MTPTLFALDVETSSADPLTCALREIALVPLDASFTPNGVAFERVVRMDPGASQEAEAFGLHRLAPDDGDWSHHVRIALRDYLPERFALLGRNVAGFDAIVLRRFLGEHVWSRCDYHVRDSAALQLAMQDAGLLPAGRLSLARLAELLGVPSEGPAHRALPDALLEAVVYRALLFRLRAAVPA